jgi:hypothetical protein
MIPVSIWSAKGEGRVGRYQKVRDDRNKGIYSRTLREHKFDGHEAAQKIHLMADALTW